MVRLQRYIVDLPQQPYYSHSFHQLLRQNYTLRAHCRLACNRAQCRVYSEKALFSLICSEQRQFTAALIHLYYHPQAMMWAFRQQDL